MDNTAAERMKRYRERQRNAGTVTEPTVTLPKYVTERLTVGELGELSREERMERYDYRMAGYGHRSMRVGKHVPPRSLILDELVAKGVPLMSDYASHYPCASRRNTESTATG